MSTINIFDGENGNRKSGGTLCVGEQEETKPSIAVRYGYGRLIGEFKPPQEELLIVPNSKLVIQTGRGIEFGELVTRTCGGCSGCVSKKQVDTYVANSGNEYFRYGNGRILRLATPDDIQEWEHIKAETRTKREFCQEKAKALGLEMKVIECEHLLGGERIIFYFMADGRVDFRQLVKQLADEFQTRIEMKQVGARDEARLLADYETCGRECCCKNFLKDLKQVTMKMAKLQKATLDPAKVSGRCGRLKCCLRFEHTTYEELDEKLPNVGKEIATRSGVFGRVVARQVFTQLLQVQTPDGGRVAVPAEDLCDPSEAPRPTPERRAPKPRPDRGGKPEQKQDSGGKPEENEASGSRRPRSRRSRGGRKRGRAGGQSGDQAAKGDESPKQPRSDKPGNEQGKSGGGEKAGGDGAKRKSRRRRRKPRGRGSDGKDGGSQGPSGGSEG
jgi:cell fate regulator YaaT (PSP1 superfamily)